MNDNRWTMSRLIIYLAGLLHLFTLPLLTSGTEIERDDTTYTITASDIIAIAPDTVSCDSAPYPSECATATQAAPYISASFQNFGVDSFGAQAALLSLMLYESGSFKYNINHYPGVPGQGTRNMQSPAFNLNYTQWLASKYSDAGFTAEQIQQADAQGPAEVLALVESDTWSFASAAWFLTTQCDLSILEGLAGRVKAGWDDYLTSCVGTSATDDRTAIWTKAIALGKW